MNKFTSTVMDDRNLDEIHAIYWNKVWYILHPNNVYSEISSRMIENWMKDHFVSDNVRNIEILQASLQGMTNNVRLKI